MKNRISQIVKFKAGNEIKEGIIHGKFTDTSFIIIVKNFNTNEDEDFLVNDTDIINFTYKRV